MGKLYQHYSKPMTSRSGLEIIKDDLGTVTVQPSAALAGEPQTYKITYIVGEQRIEIGGIVRFTIPFGFTAPQTQLPIRPGYITAKTSKKGANLETFFIENIWHKKSETRSKKENLAEHTGTHAFIKVYGRPLEKGDIITLTYGDQSYESEGAYAAKTIGSFQFDLAVDFNGRAEAPYSGFYLCDDVPFVFVSPLEAKALMVLIPSNTIVGEPCKVIVSAMDKYKNLVFDYQGTVKLYDGENLLKEIVFTKEDGGVRHEYVNLLTEGTVYLKVKDEEKGFEALSNPSFCTKEAVDKNYYWGDIHGHSGIQWGQGSADAYYEYGKIIAGLDFCCLSDPGAGRYTNDNETAKDSASCYMSDAEWRHIKQLNEKYYKPGEYVTILGYEYHNDAPAEQFGGDRNVYYATNEEDLHRCVDEGSYTPAQLWKKLEGTRAITIPHHTAKSVMLGNWDLHHEDFQRLVEIYSSWGNSECEGCERPIIGGYKYDKHSVQYALSKGYRLGFVGASDTHSGQPGFTYWVFENRSYRGGLTCAVTNELNRENIFNAMWNRQVYATTGERIILDFKLNELSMGEETTLPKGAPISLSVQVNGTDTIDKIEIIKDGSVLYSYDGKEKNEEINFVDESNANQGWSYYYARILQKDKAMAWSSPIWVIYQ